MSTAVEHDEARSVYTITKDGAEVGTIEYELDGERIIFTHTVVDPSRRGQGVGEELAQEALHDAAGKGLTIVPQCSFIARYLEDNDIPDAKVEQPGR